MQNELKTREYTKVWGPKGCCKDNITEYELVSEISLTVGQFTNLLQDAKAYLYGQIEFAKKKLTYSTGRVEFKHICRVINY